MKIKLILKNDSYGLDNSVIHEEDEPLVEFFMNNEQTRNKNWTISRYNLSIVKVRLSRDEGICLCGSNKIYIKNDELKTLVGTLNENERNLYFIAS